MNIEYESENELPIINELNYDLDLALAISESLKEKILTPKEVHELVQQKCKEFLSKN